MKKVLIFLFVLTVTTNYLPFLLGLNHAHFPLVLLSFAQCGTIAYLAYLLDDYVEAAIYECPQCQGSVSVADDPDSPYFLQPITVSCLSCETTMQKT